VTERRALVTGASSGIGREFAIQLAALGYQIVAVARREDRLRSLLEELGGSGHSLIVADLASADDLERLRRYLQETRVHLLVNNAGYSVMQPFYRSALAEQRRLLDVNCTALMTLAHTFLVQAEAGDALINLASIVAFLPTPAQPLYSASKAFIASFSQCLWEEQRHRDIYVMALCPGITRTEFIHTATGGAADGRKLPGPMVQSSEAVVREALQALQRRKRAVVVTGRANRLMLQLPRLLSRQGLLRLLAVAGDPERSL